MDSRDRARVVAIVQARMGSSRLPGKVMKDIAGKPMLHWVLRRADQIPSGDEVVLATTTDREDGPLVALGEELGYRVVQGHPVDVLDRYRQAAQEADAEVIIRLTGDCPMLDAGVSEQTLQVFLQAHGELDFVANRLLDHRTYPIGLDTEVCSRSALELAWKEAEAPHEREHVMPYLYENPGRFKTRLVDADGDWGHLRWTVDTAKDLAFVRAVYQAFSPRIDFGWREVLDLLAERPELQEINAGVEHRTLEDVDDRLSAAKAEGE